MTGSRTVPAIYFDFWGRLSLRISLHRPIARHALEYAWSSFLTARRRSPAASHFLSDDGSLDRLSYSDARAANNVPDRALGRVVSLLRSSILFFHGCALSRNGKAVVLLGRSQTGKSTFALAAIREGWTLLSDEIVPIDRFQNTVLPFPLPIHPRPATREWLRRDFPKLFRTLDAVSFHEPCGAGCLDPTVTHRGWHPAAIGIPVEKEPAPLAKVYVLAPNLPYPLLEGVLSCFSSGAGASAREVRRVAALLSKVPVEPLKGLRLHDPRARPAEEKRLNQFWR